jgi:hypothetical protein
LLCIHVLHRHNSKFYSHFKLTCACVWWCALCCLGDG